MSRKFLFLHEAVSRRKGARRESRRSVLVMWLVTLVGLSSAAVAKNTSKAPSVETKTGLSALLGDEMVPNSLVMVLVDFDDGKASADYTREQLTDIARYVQTRYLAMSYGQMDVNPDVDGDGQVDIIGPVRLQATVDVCGRGNWQPQLNQMLEDEPSYRIERYQTRLFILPRATKCSWMGEADQYCRPGVCEAYLHGPYRGVALHEIGHTLGMGHALVDPYDRGVAVRGSVDHSDPMGSSSGDKFLNAAHVFQMGWHRLYPEMVTEIKDPGIYRLAPLDRDPQQTVLPQIAKFSRKGSNQYFLSYRLQEGLDAGVARAVTGGVNINSHDGTGADSLFIATMRDGDTRTVGKMVLRQLSHNNDEVVFEVSGSPHREPR